MTVSLLIRRRKQKQHSQPDLPRMLFPQLICLVNSYSSFKIQIRYHLQKAFQATFAPPTWFRCFPTLSYYSSRGFLSCTLSILSCNYFPATKGWGWGKEDHSKWPETTRISTSIEISMFLDPTPTYWICILISLPHRWFLCILKRIALQCELPGIKNCALFRFFASFVPWPLSLGVPNLHAVALFNRWCMPESLHRVKCKCSHR